MIFSDLQIKFKKNLREFVLHMIKYMIQNDQIYDQIYDQI